MSSVSAFVCGWVRAVFRSPRIAPAVQHPPDSDLIAFDFVVDREGKSFGEQAMIPREFPMNAGVETQRLDIGVDRIEEVGADRIRRALIEAEAVEKVFLGEVE
jgi:hypothetical protein